MPDYSYIAHHIDRVIDKYGTELEIDNCEVRIDDYAFNSPQALSFAIQIPKQYLDFINLNCNLIFCNQNIFKNIGNADNEKIDRADLNIVDNTLTIEQFVNLNNNLSKLVDEVPIDHKRKNYAIMLGHMINSFIVYHELGHVRQLNSNLSALEVIVEYGSQNDGNPKWNEQAMEVDADVFAINWFGNDLFQNYHNFSPSAAFDRNEEILVLAIYAIFLLFYLSNTSSVIDNPQKTHPHPIIRFEVVVNYLQEIAIKNGIVNDKTEFGKLMHKVLHEMDKTLTCHFDLPNNIPYFRRFYESEIPRVKSDLQKFVQENQTLNFNRPYVLNRQVSKDSDNLY